MNPGRARLTELLRTWVGVLSLIGAYGLHGQNLVGNPSFEEGPQGGWGHFIPTEAEDGDCRMGVEAPGRGGRRAAWLESALETRHALVQYFEVPPGARLRCTAWVRTGVGYAHARNTLGVVLRLCYLGSNGLHVKDARGQSLATYAWLGGRCGRQDALERVAVEAPSNAASALEAQASALSASTSKAPPANKPHSTSASPKPAPASKAAPAIKGVVPTPPVKRPPPPAFLRPGTNWARIDLVAESPPGTAQVELGLWAWRAKGRSWFDDVTLEIVPKTVALTPEWK